MQMYEVIKYKVKEEVEERLAEIREEMKDTIREEVRQEELADVSFTIQDGEMVGYISLI